MSDPRRAPLRRALSPLVLLAVLALPCAPSVGAAGDKGPLLASQAAAGGGWVSVAYEIPPGGEAFLGIDAHDFAGPLHVLMAEYRTDGSLYQSFDLWRWGPEDRDPTVHAQPEGLPGVAFRFESDSAVEGSFFGMGTGRRNVFREPLVLVHLLSVAGDVGLREWRLHGTDGVRILALTQGDSAHVYRTADFLQGDGLALVAPTPPGGVLDVNAFHDARGRLDLTVENRLFGFFGAGDGTALCTDTLVADRACHDPKPTGTLAWTGPHGAGAEGPADTTHARFRDAPAGDYAFELRDWSTVSATQGGPCLGPLWICAAAAGSEVVLAVVDAAPAIP